MRFENKKVCRSPPFLTDAILCNYVVMQLMQLMQLILLYYYVHHKVGKVVSDTSN